MKNLRASERIRLVAEVGVVISLAIVLGALTRLVQMPFGGSINLSMLPIVVLALRRGSATGGACGGLFGLVDFALNPFYFHPLQVLLDYPLAFGAVGWVSGVASSRLAAGGGRWLAIASLALAGTVRLGIHWVSGMVFFAAYAPVGQPVWLYSLTYNSTYVIPETILCIALSQIVLKASIKK